MLYYAIREDYNTQSNTILPPPFPPSPLLYAGTEMEDNTQMTLENSENETDKNDSENNFEKQIIPRKVEKYIPVRQTLLFSATALQIEAVTKKNNKEKKWLDKVKIKGIGGGAVKALPLHLQQLLAVVAVMGNTHVADVTGKSAMALVGADGGAGARAGANKKGEKGNKSDKGAIDVMKEGEGEGGVKGAAGEGEEEIWDGKGEGKLTLLQ